MFLVSRMRLRTKALVPPVLFAIVATFLTWQVVSRYQADLVQERRQTMRAVVQYVLATLDYFVAAERRGDMTHEAAQHAARALLTPIRYGQGNYIIALDENAVYLIHPNSALIDVPHDDLPPEQKALSRRAVDDVRRHAEISYPILIPRPAGGPPVPRIRYVVMYQPWRWAIGTGIFMDDINASVHAYAVRLGLISLFATLLTGVLSWFALHEFDRRLRVVSAGMARLAAGDYGHPVAGAACRDEAGQLARALECVRDSLLEAARSRARHAAEAIEAAADRRRTMTRVADAFEAKVRSVAGNVSAAAEQLAATARDLHGATEAVIDNAREACAVADEANDNVRRAAAGAEQLSASIAEVSQQIAHAATVSEGAVRQAEDSSRIMRGLADSAGQIGDVVEVIQAIAGQTNMLALNATIEAARAGAAGKGFAVVASEVKSLANQTARATDSIQVQVKAVQDGTNAAVSAIVRVERTIEQMSEVARGIAGSIGHQSDAARQIAGNVGLLSTITVDVSNRIMAASGRAGEASEGANSLLTSAVGLAAASRTLDGEMDEFLAELRAG